MKINYKGNLEIIGYRKFNHLSIIMLLEKIKEMDGWLKMKGGIFCEKYIIWVEIIIVNYSNGLKKMIDTFDNR
jgi:hypothetical protein